MFNIVSAVLLVLAVAVHGFALPFEGLYKLDIIHYNDFHARFEETSVETPTCRYNNNSCLGGFPRLYHEIDVLIKEKPDSLLLNAGDSFQGTYWYTLLKWNVTQQFMNLLPHDAHAIGNHEFDDGPEGLAPYLSALKAPVLAANMDSSKEPSLQGLYKPHIIVERKGRRIGIIGLITTDTANLSSPGKVLFTDSKEATRREAQILTDKGVDIIILLSHCGLNVDKELARDLGQYIDIIVGGHTHSLLWNGPSPSREAVAGPYPVFVESSADKKHKTLIVQASAFTKYMGNLSVYFDFRGDYVKWDGGPIFLDRTISEDLQIKAKLAPFAEIVHKAENVPIGETTTTLYFEDCVFGECALGDALVDSQNLYAKEKVKSDMDYLSFVQRGNIKSTILQGRSVVTGRHGSCKGFETSGLNNTYQMYKIYASRSVKLVLFKTITEGTLFELLPFNDRMQSFELQGRWVLAALERSVIDEWGNHPFKGPWVLQLSGLQVKYNVTKPEGQRVVSATIGDKDGGAPIDSEKFYQVTVPAYLADGGDGFTMFRDHKRNVQVIGRDQKIFENFIKKHTPLNIVKDGRIKVIED